MYFIFRYICCFGIKFPFNTCCQICFRATWRVCNGVVEKMSPVPVARHPGAHNRFETRRLRLPLAAPRSDDGWPQLLPRDQQLARLEVLAADRLADIRKLQETATTQGCL